MSKKQTTIFQVVTGIPYEGYTIDSNTKCFGTYESAVDYAKMLVDRLDTGAAGVVWYEYVRIMEWELE